MRGLWPLLSEYEPRASVLVLERGERLARPDVRRATRPFARMLAGWPDRPLVAILATRDVATVAAYLAALEAGAAVMLLDAQRRPSAGGPPLEPDVVVDCAPERPAPVVAPADYRPVDGHPGSARVYARRRRRPDRALHGELSLLLGTSGTTGAQRFVRLSAANLAANAAGIRDRLGLGPHTTTVTSLPLSYSYGLSVLNSSLAAGAPIVLSDAPVASERFWRTLRERRVNVLAGVPMTYEVVVAMSEGPETLPDLRLLTQAGGRSAPRVLGLIAARLREDQALVPMYGQTEATARMTILEPAAFWTRFGSVGRPLPGGSIAIEGQDGSELPDGVEGEIVYSGPNVMLGYAAGAADLALPDLLGGRLRTGDVGYVRDGYLHVTGRRSRFAKIGGFRIGLGAVEDCVARVAPAAAVNLDDERIGVLVERPSPLTRNELDVIVRLVVEECEVPRVAVLVRAASELPRLPSGKTDYHAIEALLRA